jgi:hypothetical protein
MNYDYVAIVAVAAPIRLASDGCRDEPFLR